MNTITYKNNCREIIKNGQAFSGVVSARNILHKVSVLNNPYVMFEIKPDLLPVKAIAMKNSCKGYLNFTHGQSIYIEGHWNSFKGEQQIECDCIKYVHQTNKEIEEAKHRIRQIFDGINNPTLKHFLARILNDETIINHFISAPASLNHHHSFTGGLLVHSAEVAWNIFNQLYIKDEEKELATVAGLLHDIGKIKTLFGNMKRTEIGRFIRHEDLTLEVISDHLNWLEKKDYQTAIYLRYLLIWNKQSYSPIPKLDVAELVHALDRWSSRGIK